MPDSLRRVAAVFRLPNARRLLYVRILGQSGDGLLQTALATFVLFSPERQNSPEKIAVAFAILLIPYSIVGPFVGIFIDRWSRQKILRWANALRFALMSAIFFVVISHSQGWLLAVLVLTSLGTNRFIQACLASSVPHVVTREHLVTANALFPTLGTACAAIAAGIGIGIQKIFSSSDRTNAGLILIGALCTLIASFWATQIQPANILGPHTQRILMRQELAHSARGILDGIRSLQHSRSARNSMFAAATQRFVFGLLTIFALVLSRTSWSKGQEVGQSISDFGACAGSAALGAFVAALVSAFLLSEPDHDGHKVLRQAHLRLLSTISSVAASIIVVWGMLIGSLASVCISAFSIAFLGQLLKINADTTIQATVDDEHRGRVFSIFDMQLNASLVVGITTYALIPVVSRYPIVTGSMAAVGLLGCALLIRENKRQNIDA